MAAQCAHTRFQIRGLYVGLMHGGDAWWGQAYPVVGRQRRGPAHRDKADKEVEHEVCDAVAVRVEASEVVHDDRAGDGDEREERQGCDGVGQGVRQHAVVAVQSFPDKHLHSHSTCDCAGVP